MNLLSRYPQMGHTQDHLQTPPQPGHAQDLIQTSPHHQTPLQALTGYHAEANGSATPVELSMKTMTFQ